MRLSVLWLHEHKNVWRVAVLVLLLVAIMRPWGFDVVNVPSEYPCSAPYIRLEGDFCGIPLSGVWAYGWWLNGMVAGSRGLLRGAVSFVDWARGFLFGLLLCLFLLPVISTLLLILRGDRQRRQVFHLVAWGLAASLGVCVGMSRYPRLFWVLWGVWLYVGLAVGALTLEVLVLAAGTRGSQG